MGKPMFKPGSRNDRRLQKKLDELEQAADKAERERLRRESEGLLKGYDTIATSTNDVWEMEYEDWEESGE
jgi:sugar-specific transcriptional regulator TrmB